MQLNTMDCTGRSNLNERDSELGDDMSHDDHSDDEMRDCDSVEGDHISRVGSRLNSSMTSNGAGTAGDMSGPEHPNDMAMSHHHQFPSNHPLNALGSFMGIGSLHGIPNLQHNDVLEKLKMQVRDMKVGLMDQEYAAAHAAAFGSNVLSSPINTAFTLPPTTMASFTHAAQTLAAQAGNNINSHLNANSSSSSVGGPSVPNGSHNSFSFTSPTAPSTKDVNPASNSSTSSETSNSSQQNNGWSFEEQYKQVRQLYEINDDPKRKEFLDDLFSFMQKRGTPINRLPIMAKSVLDLYELYNLVIARGGLVDVINKKLWQEIIKGLHLPSSITSAAFTLRTQYMKYLYPYECEKKNLSTPAELQAAIDGNRREGRRSSYGQYEAMHNQMQMPQMARQSLPGGMQQMSPLALVTHAANNQQAQAAAAAAAAHHRLMAPSFGQVPNLVTQEIEQRMIEYLKLIQVKKEQNAMSNGSGAMGLSPHHQHQQQSQLQQQQQRQRSQSPEGNPGMNALEMSRVALWQMYQNNTSPPASVNTSPQGGAGSVNTNNGGSHDVQRSEAINLSDSPPNLTSIKREREREPSPEMSEHNDFHHQPPPAKRAGFPASFYLPPGMSGMAAAAAAANFHYKGGQHDSDAEADEENDDDDEGDHNTTANSSHDDPNERQHLNGSSLRAPRHHGSNSSVHNDKSDDSAIENSPSTSAASAGNGQISPVSTKKIHLSKQTQQQHHAATANNNTGSTLADNMTTGKSTSLGPFEALNLLSGMQFRVTRNGTNSNGEQELMVNLELNGIKYSGVLVANTSNQKMISTETTTSTSTLSVIGDNSFSNNKNVNNSNKSEKNITNTNRKNGSHCHSPKEDKDLVVAMDAMDDTSALTMRDTETPPNTSMTTTKTTPSTNQTNAVIANGPNPSSSSSNSNSNTLKDALITS
ncbi:Protein dead ringer [Lucilia cuprina]|uniref:Protein dead ringer n=1 Tax=Lucilia cuprina TaxID=7375 RepID=A0A0L0C9N2_LUCCU|nr:Protein dead ringer [Lucilia cuprina]